jgi:hypothetical protein
MKESYIHGVNIGLYFFFIRNLYAIYISLFALYYYALYIVISRNVIVSQKFGVGFSGGFFYIANNDKLQIFIYC